MQSNMIKSALAGGLAGALLVVGLSAIHLSDIAAAATGGTFILGQQNSADATSDLQGSVAGPQLRVTNSSPSGTAIRGRRSAASGAQPAIQGDTASTSAGATGVLGVANSTSAAGDSNGVQGSNSGAGRGVFGQSNSGTGVYGNSKSQYGVWGIGSYGLVGGGSEGGVWASTGSASGSGVYGQNTASGNGVFGKSTSGYGVRGDGKFGVVGFGTDAGVWASSSTSAGSGVYGQSTSTGAGVYGKSSAANGVYGKSDGTGAGVLGEGLMGVIGHGDSGGNGKGVRGTGRIGVEGEGLVTGVWGHAPNGTGVEASGTTGVKATGTDYAGDFSGKVSIVNDGGTALTIRGGVLIDGSLAATGPKDFRIDHPLAPGKKYLLHAAIESPEVLNMYSGNVVTDERGRATVRLPAYFDAINKDFRYQLTPVGGLVLAAVVEEIHDNRFTIETSKPRVKVSWQVTGVRNDRYMRQHPFRSVLPKQN